ncbi:MAG: DUF1275 domain-containing protein [Defluviitaleaceae bacterium]|nr:DUF1275 domain-containing protein [Defluviitaleaceae bacterium]
MSKSNIWRVGFITLASTFILGFLNGHTQSLREAFVSPQTGNLINLGLDIANADIPAIITGSLMFSAFVLGCIIAHLFIRRKIAPRLEFFLGWSLFVLPIFIYLIFEQYFSDNGIIFLLSCASGIALGFFRKIGHVELNNNIVTGNMRFLGINLVESLLTRDGTRIRAFWIYFAGIFAFFLGALICGLILRAGEMAAFWALSAFMVAPYFVGIGISETKENP